MNRPRSIHVKATVISTAISPGPLAMNTTTARLLANIFAEAYDEAGSPPPLLKERQPSRSELDLETSSFTLNNGQGMPAASSETARAGCPLGYPKKGNPPVNPPVAQPGQLAILPQSSRGVPLGPTATTRTPAKRHLSDRGRSLSLPNPVQSRPDSRPLNDYERYVYRLARIPGRCLHASAHHGAPPPHRYVYPDGSSFEGEFIEGRMHGRGSYTDGQIRYDGEFVENLKEGRGVLRRLSTGERLEATWVADQVHGLGTLTSPSGDKYVGAFVGGKKHGIGELHYANGDMFRGQWIDDRAEGQGVMLYANNSRYEGSWRDNQRNGMGTFHLTDGSKYEGLWLHGRKEGKGALLLPSGATFSSMWTQGGISGQGLLELPEQSPWLDPEM